MIKPGHILVSLLYLFCPAALHSQFVNIQITIEPELNAAVEQNLSFGTVVTNSGVQRIELGDLNMGVYRIRALYTQNVFLELDYPEALVHTNPRVPDKIPLNLSVAYNNKGHNSISDSVPLEGNFGYLSVSNSAQEVTPDEIWSETYVYVYGSIDVGNIPNGEYVGDIVLVIEYD